jgi:hypothetical protein
MVVKVVVAMSDELTQALQTTLLDLIILNLECFNNFVEDDGSIHLICEAVFSIGM